MKPNYQTQPLTHQERDHLQLIYNSRLRIFTSVFLVMILVAIYWSFRYAHPQYESDLDFSTQLLINLLATCGLTIFFALLIYYRRIDSYRADIKIGVKDMVPYQILEKEYFPLTGRYYFRIDDPDNMHFEVDEDRYNSCTSGETIYIPRAPKSKYTFEYGGRFELM